MNVKIEFSAFLYRSLSSFPKRLSRIAGHGAEEEPQILYFISKCMLLDFWSA